MKLADAPEGLDPTFDMHGVHFEVVPEPSRHVRETLRRAGWVGVTFFFAVILAFVTAGFIWRTGVPFTPWMLALCLIAPIVWMVSTSLFGVADEASRTERIRVRVGEGWLVLGHKNLGKSERFDLTTAMSCMIVRGPDLRIERYGMEPVVIPMRGHGLPEIGWAAMAINQAIRDVRYSDAPAPEALVAMLREPEG